MDYLTILATRSLILFSGGKPSSSVTPMSWGISPPPVSMPLLSLMHDDTHCAFFLANHVLNSVGAPPATHAVANDATHRAMNQHAEVLAWQQIDRAKTFARELGLFYGRVDSVCEEEIAALAASHGIGFAPPGPAHSRTRVLKRHEHERYDLSCDVVLV